MRERAARAQVPNRRSFRICQSKSGKKMPSGVSEKAGCALAPAFLLPSIQQVEAYAGFTLAETAAFTID
jgi:hypothetical protein